jgi:hypothetical protein
MKIILLIIVSGFVFSLNLHADNCLLSYIDTKNNQWNWFDPTTHENCTYLKAVPMEDIVLDVQKKKAYYVVDGMIYGNSWPHPKANPEIMGMFPAEIRHTGWSSPWGGYHIGLNQKGDKLMRSYNVNVSTENMKEWLETDTGKKWVNNEGSGCNISSALADGKLTCTNSDRSTSVRKIYMFYIDEIREDGTWGTITKRGIIETENAAEEMAGYDNLEDFADMLKQTEYCGTMWTGEPESIDLVSFTDISRDEISRIEALAKKYADVSEGSRLAYVPLDKTIKELHPKLGVCLLKASKKGFFLLKLYNTGEETGEPVLRFHLPIFAWDGRISDVKALEFSTEPVGTNGDTAADFDSTKDYFYFLRLDDSKLVLYDSHSFKPILVVSHADRACFIKK